jgi:hypothetical protein
VGPATASVQAVGNLEQQVFLAQKPDSSWQLWEADGPNGPMSAVASFGAGDDPIHGNLPDLTA